ncbi:uncharacterized protein LOC113906695 [Bos indicus x Bos taurus]|uniref:uncharacterized protein LOC113906695 n=1 Tax=Bos indicus x Bos taurus TaxID=30522 RepID=UPI000F7D3369|nr:uncharacterized protein LOC113906695 [Bos indicus x Bos taurus]
MSFPPGRTPDGWAFPQKPDPNKLFILVADDSPCPVPYFSCPPRYEAGVQLGPCESGGLQLHPQGLRAYAGLGPAKHGLDPASQIFAGEYPQRPPLPLSCCTDQGAGLISQLSPFLVTSPEFHLLGHLCEYLRVKERRRGFAGLLGTLMCSFLSAWWPSCGCHCESRCTLKLGCLAASLSQRGDIGASSTSLTHVGPPWPMFHRTWMPGWPMFPGHGCQASKRLGSGKANLGVAAQLQQAARDAGQSVVPQSLHSSRKWPEPKTFPPCPLTGIFSSKNSKLMLKAVFTIQDGRKCVLSNMSLFK